MELNTVWFRKTVVFIKRDGHNPCFVKLLKVDVSDVCLTLDEKKNYAPHRLPRVKM
jgi:hypothetical protein